MSKFANKGTEVDLRISSLDYLGVAASGFRRDAVQSRLKIDTIDSITASVKENESENGDVIEVDKDEKGKDLLDYLTVTGGQEDPATHSARHFYISHWYRDAKRKKGIDKPKYREKQEK